MTYRICLQPGDHQFDAAEGESILEATLAAGLVLPYSCRDGACGACKGRIVEGSVRHGKHASSALSAEEEAAGGALLCCAHPLSDLVVEARSVSKAGSIQVKKLPARVKTLRRLAEDVMLVELKLPASEEFLFRPGQYIDIVLADGERRSFSIANAPRQGSELELHVRRIDGGRFTPTVFSTLKVKDILRLEGPLGSFSLRTDSQRPAILLAGGTGFAPIKSIVEDAIARGETREFHLYWGARQRDGLYLDELVNSWANELSGLRYIPVLSASPPGEPWQGRRGLVHEAVMADFADLSAHEVYACGSPAMVEAAQKAFCEQRALPEDAFFADAFTFSTPNN